MSSCVVGLFSGSKVRSEDKEAIVVLSGSAGTSIVTGGLFCGAGLSKVDPDFPEEHPIVENKSAIPMDKRISTLRKLNFLIPLSQLKENNATEVS